MAVPGARRAGVRALGRAALMPVAAFAVHELRFLAAFGGQAGVELQRQGHSYLQSLVPWIVLVIAVSVGGFLWALGRALSGQRSLQRYSLSLIGLWFVCSAALVTIYVSQEFLEGLFVTGHPAGLAGVFGHGGWWSVPAALGVGLILAAVFHGARRVLDEVAKRHAGPLIGSAARALAVAQPGDVRLSRLAPLAEGWSDRGPPSS